MSDDKGRKSKCGEFSELLTNTQFAFGGGDVLYHAQLIDRMGHVQKPGMTFAKSHWSASPHCPP